MNKQDFKKLGTTIVGIRGKDFAIVLGDSQTTLGNIAIEEGTKKVHKVSKYTAIATSGSVGDINYILKILDLENRYHLVNLNDELDVDEVNSILSSILYYKYLEMPFFPFLVGLILVGYSKQDDKFKLFQLDPIGGGSEMDKDYASFGSGWELALSILDKEYKKDLSLEEAIEIGIEAIKASQRRDIYSGGKKIYGIAVLRNKVIEFDESNYKELI